LATSGMPILAIALHFGYSDQSHFTRRFRARYGLTPLAYRRRHAGRQLV
ncbi:MAG: AraC family transcriptional regulator, partial [Planctomycetota bacterium]